MERGGGGAGVPFVSDWTLEEAISPILGRFGRGDAGREGAS